MARYSLYVLKVPLNTKQTNKQTNILVLVCLCAWVGVCISVYGYVFNCFTTAGHLWRIKLNIYCLGPYLSVSVLALSRRTCHWLSRQMMRV